MIQLLLPDYFLRGDFRFRSISTDFEKSAFTSFVRMCLSGADGLERTDTFKDRVLDETPKFVCEKLAKAQAATAANGSGIGTSDPAFS